MLVLLVLGALVISTPIAAAVLVTYASQREDAAHSLCGRPRGRLEAAARGLLGFRSVGVADMIRPRVRAQGAPADDDQRPDRPLAAPRS